MKGITNPNSVVWLPRKRKLIFFFLIQFFPGAKREQIEYNNKIRKKKNHDVFRRKKILGCVCVPEREREQKNRMENCFWVGTCIFGERERERERLTFCLLRNMGPSWLGRSTRSTRPSWVFEMRSHVWEECYNETMSNARHFFWQKKYNFRKKLFVHGNVLSTYII